MTQCARVGRMHGRREYRAILLKFYLLNRTLRFQRVRWLTSSNEVTSRVTAALARLSFSQVSGVAYDEPFQVHYVSGREPVASLHRLTRQQPCHHCGIFAHINLRAAVYFGCASTRLTSGTPRWQSELCPIME